MVIKPVKNGTEGRDMGVKRVVFHKHIGIAYRAITVKIKAFRELRDFGDGKAK